jgi:hypothetical protein
MADAAPARRTLDLVTLTAPAGWAVEERAGGIGTHVVLTRASTPWFEYIAAGILTNPEQGTNLDRKWIRLGS